MPNSNTPRGFKPVQTVGGAPYTGAQTAYKLASGTAANIGAGDMVKLLSTGYVTVAAAADRVLGVCTGVAYIGSDGIPVARPNWISGTTTLGSQDAVIFVADDPNLVVEAQFSGAVAVPNSSIGNTFPLVAGTVDSLGRSAQAVDSSTLTATTLQTVRYLGPAPKADNDAASAYAIGRFALLNHEFRATTGV